MIIHPCDYVLWLCKPCHGVILRFTVHMYSAARSWLVVCIDSCTAGQGSGSLSRATQWFQYCVIRRRIKTHYGPAEDGGEGSNQEGAGQPPEQGIKNLKAADMLGYPDHWISGL